MALSTSRVCVPAESIRLCPPKRHVCPGNCQPGFCLNAECLYNTRPEVVYSRPEVDEEADLYRQRIEQIVKQQKNIDRLAFLASERNKMGMSEFENEEKQTVPGNKPEGNDRGNTLSFSEDFIDLNQQKEWPSGSWPSGSWSSDRKSAPKHIHSLTEMTYRRKMRAPARPSCMLPVPGICQTQDDYTQLSLFLRSSTMPYYSRNDTISKTRDAHNMAVWNNRKDIDRQIHKLKRDWFSIWGEKNFIEQRWRKSWAEKFPGNALKR